METTTKNQQFSDLISKGLAELDLPEKPSLLYDPVCYTLSLPGKRVRPYLTLVGCGLCGGEIKEALNAALSIELLHNFTLLHDDIMDRADKRRGKPSVFKKWNANTAILSGDAMYAKAFKQLQYYGRNEAYSKNTYAKILDIFLESAKKVCEGQAYDLTFENKEGISIEHYIHMIEGKTAALISGALAMGGAVGSADDVQIEELITIGRKTGTAFQIQDDLLDVIADPEKFGKKQGGDIIEGKKTYLSLLTLERCNKEEKERLLETLSSASVTRNDIFDVLELYKAYNIIEDTKKTILDYYKSAISHLELFGPSEYKIEMKDFLNQLISREF